MSAPRPTESETLQAIADLEALAIRTLSKALEPSGHVERGRLALDTLALLSSGDRGQPPAETPGAERVH